MRLGTAAGIPSRKYMRFSFDRMDEGCDSSEVTPPCRSSHMIGLGKHQPHSDVSTHGVRVRTQHVRLLDEQISLGPGKPREVNPEFHFNPESLRCRSHTDFGFNLGPCRELNVVASGNDPHDSQEAGRIAGCEQLLRSGPPAVPPAQLARPGHLQIQNAVGGDRPDIPSGRRLHLGAVQNLLYQHAVASFCCRSDRREGPAIEEPYTPSSRRSFSPSCLLVLNSFDGQATNGTSKPCTVDTPCAMQSTPSLAATAELDHRDRHVFLDLLVVDVLVAMGYGSSQEDAARVVGQSRASGRRFQNQNATSRERLSAQMRVRSVM